MLLSTGWLGLARGTNFFRMVYLVRIVIPTGASHTEGDEKRSGGTCCLVHGQQRIGKQKQKPRRAGASRFPPLQKNVKVGQPPEE